MIKVMKDFVKTMVCLPIHWLIWVFMLVIANLLNSLFFLNSKEAWVVLLCFFLAAMIQMTIYKFKGFVRLLGLGHFLWFLLVPWLWTRLDYVDDGSIFRVWILSVILLNSISLVIDVIDVTRYILGDREPTLMLE